MYNTVRTNQPVPFTVEGLTCALLLLRAVYFPVVCVAEGFPKHVLVTASLNGAKQLVSDEAQRGRQLTNDHERRSVHGLVHISEPILFPPGYLAFCASK